MRIIIIIIIMMIMIVRVIVTLKAIIMININSTSSGPARSARRLAGAIITNTHQITNSQQLNTYTHNQQEQTQHIQHITTIKSTKRSARRHAGTSCTRPATGLLCSVL